VIGAELELRRTFGAQSPALMRGYEGPHTDLS
jgi:hypothetical protein